MLRTPERKPVLSEGNRIRFVHALDLIKEMPLTYKNIEIAPCVVKYFFCLKKDIFWCIYTMKCTNDVVSTVHTYMEKNIA